MNNYSVSLSEIIKEFALEVLYLPQHPVNVTCPDVNRPGLPLDGFFDHFEPQRIEIIGKVEHLFLLSLDDKTRKEREYNFYSHKPVAVIYTTELEVPAHILDYAYEFDVPVLKTNEKTSAFMSALIVFLSNSLAPRITRHGVMVEVYGEGILMMGDSGIGKSETAIELVKRGHRLIADDAVEIKKISDKTLIGSAPESIRHYVELRGIGIIDIRRIFGMGAIKHSEKIDLIINLEFWSPEKDYNRFGTANEYMNIMGVEVPKYTIPVKPGRNLAIILEIAAMNHRQKKMGYNTAKELEESIMASILAAEANQ